MDDSLFFGLTRPMNENAMHLCVAISIHGRIAMFYESPSNVEYGYMLGKFQKADIMWDGRQKSPQSSGKLYTCAIVARDNRSDYILVGWHTDKGDCRLHHRLGIAFWDQDEIEWIEKERRYNTGLEMAFASTSDGRFIEVHRGDENSYELYWNVGYLHDGKFKWAHEKGRRYDTGVLPKIACAGTFVVEVHTSEKYETDIYYNVGSVTADNKIDWIGPRKFAHGLYPSVAICGISVIVTFEGHKNNESGGTIYQKTGILCDREIIWNDVELPFDFDGHRSAVAAVGGGLAVVGCITYKSSLPYPLIKYSASLFRRKAGWMYDMQGMGIGFENMRLQEVVLPASHNSAMVGLSINPSSNQNLSIRQQLDYGIRYFDFRVARLLGDLVMYHGYKWVLPHPLVEQVLHEISDFLNDTSIPKSELIFLHFSHFKDFKGETHDELISLIKRILGPWLYRAELFDRRLADVRMKEFLSSGSRVIIGYHHGLVQNHQRDGLWVYTDSSASPENLDAADIIVFDEYSNTSDFGAMKKDQTKKFLSYDGKCQKDKAVPCDFYLMSWTLTGWQPWSLALEANRFLGDEVNNLPIPRKNIFIPNILYADYVQYARVTDIAFWLNMWLLGTKPESINEET